MTRKAAVASALVIASVAAAGAFVLAQQDASGADSGTSSEFKRVGTGALPTSAPKLGDLRDPLSAAETGYALHLVTKDDSIPADATDVRGKPGVEFLWSDIPEGDTAGSTRQAVVTVYDYTSDKATNLVVDLKAGKVVKSTTAAKLQPPTSSTEADVAIDVAIKSEEKLAFKDDFEASQGVPLISADQVNYVAGAWIYDGTTTKGKECGADRCAQLMVSAADGGYLDTLDFVVNLSTQSIVAIN